MAISYSFDPRRALIRVEPTGVVTSDDIRDFFNRLASDPECPDDAIEVVSSSQIADIEFHYSQATVLVREYQALREKKRIRATVFVSGSPLAHGVARMLQALFELEVPPHHVRVAGSPDEVEEKLRRYQEIGARHIMLTFLDYPGTEGIELFLSDVLPRFKEAA